MHDNLKFNQISATYWEKLLVTHVPNKGTVSRPKNHWEKKGQSIEKLGILEQALEKIPKWPINTKRHSTSLDNRKTQIKTTVNYYLAESECVTLKTNNKTIGKNME